MTNNTFAFHYLLDGFQLIFKPELRRYVIIPFCINILFFLGLFFLFNHYMLVFNQWFMQLLPSYLAFLATILWMLFFITFFIFFIYTFLTIANIIAAPFNSQLSEKVEFYLTGKEIPASSFTANMKDIPRILKRQIQILMMYIPWLIILGLCLFIPIVQSFVAIFWFLFNAWMLTLTYLDYPTDNHRIPLATVKEWMQNNRVLTLSFGLSVLLFSMLPVINFFAMPAAVAASTKLWLEQA